MIVIDGVEMVDVREAARLARRTPETIRRWVWTGRISSTKSGNRLLVPRAAVLADARSSAASSGVSSAASSGPGSLAEWGREVAAAFDGVHGSTAADLVLDDREDRSRHAGR
ncbi:MAG TPA: helix-turn-helix domain-containing protein [Marmoricola sp.]|jgi:excisionase family DNA binding protein|nr:helix-turn-helix domain-containing protein [Marmoricola sp.]